MRDWPLGGRGCNGADGADFPLADIANGEGIFLAGRTCGAEAGAGTGLGGGSGMNGWLKGWMNGATSSSIYSPIASSISTSSTLITVPDRGSGYSSVEIPNHV